MQGCGFPWHFKVWGGGSWSREECGAQSFFVCWEMGLTVELSWRSGTVCSLQERGIRSIDLKPFFHVFSYSSICGFKESFFSHWLWNVMGVLWDSQCLSSWGS